MSKKLHFKITLVESKPSIWRAFQVTDDYRFDRFHQVIQIVMGWQNSHLHEFQLKDRQIGMVDDSFIGQFPNLEDETKIYLRDIDLQEKDSFAYLYDFGDSWLHLIQLEDISSEPLLNPVCLDGRNACPMEDSGGVWGYTELLKISKDPSHPEHDEYMQSFPPNFDPSFFPKEAIIQELQRFGAWHRKHPRKRSTPWHQL